LEENILKETDTVCCHQTIYCYFEEQKDGLDKFISEHDNDSVIHVFSSVIESCEGNLFYCLGDIINNYIEKPQENVWFVTDIKFLFDIVKKLYPFLFEEIIYIEQGNKKEFNKELDINALASYFLDIQKSKLNVIFMRRLLELKDSRELKDYSKFLYEFDKIEINNDGHIKDLWCCFCAMLLYGNDNSTQKDYFYFRLAVYSILMNFSQDAYYTNAYINEVISCSNINEESLYFVWNQFKRASFKKIVKLDENSGKLLDKVYDKCYTSLADKFKEYLMKMPLEKRDKDTVIIFTIQFLDTTHAPTRSVIERAKALSKLGKKVMVVNTSEQYTMQGYLPMYKAGYGRVLKEYDNVGTMKLGDVNIQFLQLPEEYPAEYKVQVLSELVGNLRPYYILSIGAGSMLADLFGNVVPCVSMALVFSTMPKTKNKMRILGRKLYPEEEKCYEDADIIESRFTFELKPQRKHFLRFELGLPREKFMLAVIGIRLQYDVSDAFLDMLGKVCKAGCHVVFAGIMDNYKQLMEKHPAVSAHSTFIGYCDDILALMEICDLYVNPDRIGGGYSVIEAFARKVPGVYLKKGDVYVAGGEEFAVNNFEEMAEQILKYKNNKEYYKEMAKQAKMRANFMTASKKAMEDIDEKICQRIEEKYW